MATLKLLGIFGLLGAYFRFFVFGAGYEQVDLQAGLLLAFLAVSVWRNGPRGTVQAMWFILPFVLSLILFGAIFQWVGLMGRTDWIHDSLMKALVFPNSFLAVKLGLEAITFRDIVHLPLGGGGRRNAIVLGRDGKMHSTSAPLPFFHGPDPAFRRPTLAQVPASVRGHRGRLHQHLRPGRKYPGPV